MIAPYRQQLVPSAIVLATAIAVAWLSFTQEPKEAFLFPRIISIVFATLAMWNFARAAMGVSRVGAGFSFREAMHVTPGLVIMLAYAFFLAGFLGFYTGGTLAFLLVYAIYDPQPLNDMGGWAKKLLITAGFMSVIYGLFNLLLKVQTPRGLLF